MPETIEYTPPWLARPSPGSSVFTSSTDRQEGRGIHDDGAQSNEFGSSDPYLGPKKLIANRGTEVFVVVDNQVRWSDLCMLKEDYEAERGTTRGFRSTSNTEKHVYQVSGPFSG